MQQYLELVDGKASKFWRVEVLDTELVTHWGKIGTTGRVALKEFDTPEDCEAAARKLADSKLKKGYAQTAFDPDQHRFLDDEEYGLHPLTSHPRFREYFTDELYYDEGDEETPFGSDDGADALGEFAENLKSKRPAGPAEFPRILVEREWELPYLPPQPNPTLDSLQADIATAEEANPGIGERTVLQCDRVILATTLGAIKITGDAPPEAIELALNAITRMERFWENEGEAITDDNPLRTMRADLTRFAERR